jgi:hypothetical protein
MAVKIKKANFEAGEKSALPESVGAVELALVADVKHPAVGMLSRD